MEPQVFGVLFLFTVASYGRQGMVAAALRLEVDAADGMDIIDKLTASGYHLVCNLAMVERPGLVTYRRLQIWIVASYLYSVLYLFTAVESDVVQNRMAGAFGRGDDTVGNPHRAQISKFEFFELVLFLKLNKGFPVEQFEATVSQSTVPSPPLRPTRCTSSSCWPTGRGPPSFC